MFSSVTTVFGGRINGLPKATFLLRNIYIIARHYLLPEYYLGKVLPSGFNSFFSKGSSGGT